MLEGLECADQHPELDALLGVGDADLDRPLGETDVGHRRERSPFVDGAVPPVGIEIDRGCVADDTVGEG